MFVYEDYEKSAKYISNRLGNIKPKIAIVLGSGLGDLCDEIEDRIVINYSKIPNFPVSTVEGHAGELIIGKISGKDIIAMNRKISLL